MTVPCPTSDTLLHMLRGTLANSDQEKCEHHIETCVHCQGTLASLTDADEILPGIGPWGGNRPDQENLRTGGQEEKWDEVAVRLADALVRQAHCENLAPGNKGASSPATESLPQIPGYEVHGLLGRGGMGAVYDAVHLRFQRPVAIKTLPEATRANPEMLARFAREMASIGQLDHPHIVQAYDAAEHEGLHYLVMERVAGCTLSEIAKHVPRLNIADACEIIRQAASGLQHAHLHGLIHRDIKPSNIMLTQEGVVKILDLGLARLTEYDEHSLGELTCTGQIIGTVDYMAPEQAAGRHDVGSAADIYSLGATLYRLLAGNVPFHGEDYRWILQKLNALATQSPPSLRSIRPSIPKKIDSIVRRMMVKEPENRFSDVGQVVDALLPHCLDSKLSALVDVNLAARDNAEIGTGDTTRLEAPISTVAITAEEPSNPPIANRHLRRNPILAVTTFAFLLLGTLAAALWGNRLSLNRLDYPSPQISATVVAGPAVLIKPTNATSTTDSSDLYPARHLIDGSGLHAVPTIDNYAGRTHAIADHENAWVTTVFKYDGDYFEDGPGPPELLFQLDAICQLTHIIIWGMDFDDPNNNEPKVLEVSFSVDGGSTYSNTLSVLHRRSGKNADTIDLGGNFLANAVRMLITDNHFETPGAKGGDRVGMSEVRFLGSPTLSH